MQTDMLKDAEVRFLNRVKEATTGRAGHTGRSTDESLCISADDSALAAQIAARRENDINRLVETFRKNAEPLGIHIYEAGSYEEAADRILIIGADREVEFGDKKHIIQHQSPILEKLSLWKRIGLANSQLHTTFADDPELREKTIASFIGITAADIGIAETATLVQATVAGAPRSTSLVPSIHIGVLERKRLVANLKEAGCLLRRMDDAQGYTFITGPSKTADIEAHMVHGAHGPREVHVIIV